jgi:hypothetical protein
MARPRLDVTEHLLRGTLRADRHQDLPRIEPAHEPDPDEDRRLDAASRRVRGTAGRAFFARLRGAYGGWTAGAVELLAQAAALAQLIADAEAEIRRDGMTVVGAKGGTVRHPALIVAAQARTELRHTMRALKLEG